MKNILTENMLRFGTKNLNETIRKKLHEATNYESSMESLYQGVVTKLNDALKKYQAANPTVSKFKDKVYAWGKKGLGTPADPNTVGVNDVKYYIIYGQAGRTIEEENSVTNLKSLLVANGPQGIANTLIAYLNEIPQEIQNYGAYRNAKTVIDNWKKTYTTPVPPSKD